MEEEVIIFHAIYNDDLTALGKALERFDINYYQEDSFGETPLIYAVMMEKDRIVEWLLDHGADMYSKNIFDDTAFHLAAKKGYFPMVRSFCEHGIMIDVVGQEGFTALNYAVWRDHNEIAAYLIEQGASLDIPDAFFNKTPFDQIKDKGDKELLSLIEKRAKPTAYK